MSELIQPYASKMKTNPNKYVNFEKGANNKDMLAWKYVVLNAITQAKRLMHINYFCSKQIQFMALEN